MAQQLAIPVFRTLDDARLNESLRKALVSVLDSRWYILGQQVNRFETAFAEYCGSAHCIGLANGTDALELGLRALGVGPQDGVALVPNAGFYGSTAVHSIGAIPLYVDVDPSTLTMCPTSLQKILDSRPKAILVTHLYGMLADMDRIIALADRLKIPVVEDCAQAHGAQRRGRRAGSIGKLGCFSFYPTKNLGALGDGGAVVTDDPDVANVIRELRQYGWSKKYHVTRLGGRNSRLDELQAAVLTSKLPFLDSWNAQRRAIAGQYVAALRHFPFKLPPSVDLDYVAHLFVARFEQRDRLRDLLQQAGIGSDVHYPVPDFLQTAYATGEGTSLTNTLKACESVITLPCFPGMTSEEVARVIAAVSEGCAKCAG